MGSDDRRACSGRTVVLASRVLDKVLPLLRLSEEIVDDATLLVTNLLRSEEGTRTLRELSLSGDDNAPTSHDEVDSPGRREAILGFLPFSLAICERSGKGLDCGFALDAFAFVSGLAGCRDAETWASERTERMARITREPLFSWEAGAGSSTLVAGTGSCCTATFRDSEPEGH
jgi:hypothetical protein